MLLKSCIRLHFLNNTYSYPAKSDRSLFNLKYYVKNIVLRIINVLPFVEF